MNARLAKWSILLSQYDIIFVPQKAVKGQALAVLLGAHPLRENFKLQEELPDEAVYCTEVASRPTSKAWEIDIDLYCDSKTDEKGRPTFGVGIVFITPEGNMIPYSFTLSESCSKCQNTRF